jgi:uncharacterized protein (DUF1800 family)
MKRKTPATPIIVALALLAVAASPIAAKKALDSAAKFQHKLKADKQIEHALNRLSFGARPEDAATVKKMGLKRWIEQQLNPAALPENPALVAKLAPLETLTLSTAELAKRYPAPQVLLAVATGKMDMPQEPELRELYERLSARYKVRIDAKENKIADKKGLERPERMEEPAKPAAVPEVTDIARRRLGGATTEQRSKILRSFAPQQAVAGELTEAKIYRAVYSERQLEEVLTDFWFNHFNIYLDKGADKWLTTAFERDAVRPHVLGNFKDLLRATAEHPAMLFYLDNWQSISNDTGEKLRRVAPKAKTRGLNENYARELMELHTLGVDGGYTQKDVQEVARCFTGWTIREPNRGGEFYFAPRAHDNGEKTVLGVTIPAGGGVNDGLQVIDILAKHPSTAKFLSRKLAMRFVADEPPPALVNRMAASYLKTGGDLKAVLRTMIDSPEFFSEGAYLAKMKSPLEMVAGALRATGATVTNALPVSQAIANMGQPLYRKQEPTGYSNNGEEWVNSAGLLARINFALGLSENKIPGVKIDSTQYGAVAKSMGAPEWQRR